MKHELWYSVVVRDRQGKVVSRERRKIRSLVKQWNQLLYVSMSQTSLDIKDINGVMRSISPSGNAFRMVGGATNLGVVCGTGDTAVAIDDYQLGALIGDGVGAGLFEYQGNGTCTEVSLVDSSAEFIVSRTAINNSGDTITVKEVGIHTWLQYEPSEYFGLLIRDVLGTPQAVPNGGAITVDFTLRRTV